MTIVENTIPNCAGTTTQLPLSNPSLLKSRAYINGEWLEGNSSIEIKNPATESLIGQVANLGASETESAVAAAEAALPQWRQTTVKHRATLLRRWFDLIMENQEDLAQILTAEQGKPLNEARGEIAYGASYIEWFAEEAKRIDGDIIPAPNNSQRVMTIKQGVGVVAAITPWNFPNAMITRKLAPALAAGCTAVCKPATETPLSALALCVLAEQAGIPAGVINMVTGSSSRVIGKILSSHPSIKKLTFTGSTPVGKVLMEQCASTVKKTSMELGGNAPFIVFEDADIDDAVTGALASKFRNAGQTCVCSNRFLVHESVAEEFTQKLSTAAAKLRTGQGTNPDTDMGPMINTRAVENTQLLVDEALSNGATVTTGGSRSSLGSCFFEPTVLANAQPNMRVFKEEIFGPVAPVFSFQSTTEAINMANDTEFGLAAYLYTKDLSRIFNVSDALEYGMIGINTGIISNEMAPFGGVKESGNGREGSKYGLDDYLELKYLCLGGLNHKP
jgi:succinate-semialdehyde dehydrogenase / glutarate-semialdehyde dehydrogenase